jgi:hypothetical protein
MHFINRDGDVCDGDSNFFFLGCLRISGIGQKSINVIKICLLLIAKWAIVVKQSIITFIISNVKFNSL